jgi:hypothetical protein
VVTREDAIALSGFARGQAAFRDDLRKFVAHIVASDHCADVPEWAWESPDWYNGRAELLDELRKRFQL